MNETTPIAAGEFVPLATLQQELGLHRTTLRRRLYRAKVPLFLDPVDERVRLVRREDAEAVLRPRPAPDRVLTTSTATDIDGPGEALIGSVAKDDRHYD